MNSFNTINTLPDNLIGVSCKNASFNVDNFPTDYATENTLSNIHSQLNDNNLGVTCKHFF